MNPELPIPVPTVGAIIQVGEFFWICPDDFIGYAANAQHGHGLTPLSVGSVDETCTLEILATGNGYAIVRLNRPNVPYGADAARGTVFQVSLARIAAWPRMIAARADLDRQRKTLAARFCT